MNTIGAKRLFFFTLLSLLSMINVPEGLTSIFTSADKKSLIKLREKYLSPNLAIPTGSIASQLTEYGKDIVKYISIDPEKFSTEELRTLLAVKSALSGNFRSFLTTMKTTLAHEEALAHFKIEYLGKDIPGFFDADFFNGVLTKRLKSLDDSLEVLVHLGALIIVFPAAINLDTVKNILGIRFFMARTINKHGEELVRTFFDAHTDILAPALLAGVKTTASKKTSLFEKIIAVDMGLHVASMPLRALLLPQQYKQAISFYRD